MSVSSKLVNNESLEETFVYVADYEHIAANATSSNQVTIGKIPAGGGVMKVVVHEATALAGASDITLDVGTTAGDPDEFIDALDVDAMSAPVANTGDLFVQAAGTTTIAGGALPIKLVQTDTDILVEWNGTVASLTAGKVVVSVTVLNLGKFA
jgi:hypothetical protein